MLTKNLVIVAGNLGDDPDLRYSPGGAAVCNIRVATTQRWKDKQTGDLREKTEWHRITLFGRRGEVAAENLRKGSQVYIEGKLQTKKWTDKHGVDRWTTEIVADEVQFPAGLLKKKEGFAQPGQPRASGPEAARQAANPPASPSAGAGDVNDVDYDPDDVPF